VSGKFRPKLRLVTKLGQKRPAVPRAYRRYSQYHCAAQYVQIEMFLMAIVSSITIAFFFSVSCYWSRAAGRRRRRGEGEDFAQLYLMEGHVLVPHVVRAGEFAFV
jgi:hypothetical protein